MNVIFNVSFQGTSDHEFTATIKNDVLPNYVSKESDIISDTPNHINPNNASMDTNAAACDGSGVTIIENGIESKPTLKYEYKPG